MAPNLRRLLLAALLLLAPREGGAAAASVGDDDFDYTCIPGINKSIGGGWVLVGLPATVNNSGEKVAYKHLMHK